MGTTRTVSTVLSTRGKYWVFTDPEFAQVGLSETEAKERGNPYRLAKIPTLTIYRARTLDETRDFLKALIDTKSDCILGFTALGADAGEIMQNGTCRPVVTR